MSKESALAMTATIPSGEGSPSLVAPVVTTEEPQLESTRFSHLAKKEAALQKDREAYKKDQAEIASEKEKLKSVQTQINDFLAMKDKDPVAAIKLLGFSETDLFNFIAAQEDNSTPEERAAKAAQAEIKKFTDAQEAEKSSAQKERDARAIADFKKGIGDTMTANAEAFEYCNYKGPEAIELALETVTEVLTEELKVNPEAQPISAKDALEMVEKYYEQEDQGMNSLKKRQPKEPLVEQPKKEEPLKPQVSPRPLAKPTLSNKTGATIASTVAAPKNETREQKRDRLIGKYLVKAN